MRKLIFLLVFVFSCLGDEVALEAQTNSISVKLDEETKRLLLSATEDKWFKKENFVSTVLGGVLAMGGGLAASWWSHSLQAKRKRQEDKEFVTNFLRAIRWELEALREIYENGIGALFKQVKTGEIFLWRLALTEDWFTIFKSNADNLGKIDGQLSRRIVASYARLKHLIEEFRINNDYVQLREQTAWQLQQLGAAAPPSLVVKGQRIESLMVAQVGRMRQSEQVATDAVQKLFTMLDQEGIR